MGIDDAIQEFLDDIQEIDFIIEDDTEMTEKRRLFADEEYDTGDE